MRRRLDGEGPLVGIDVGDDGAGAVVDAEAAVVAKADDVVAGLEGPVVDDELGAGEVPGAWHLGAGVGR